MSHHPAREISRVLSKREEELLNRLKEKLDGKVMEIKSERPRRITVKTSRENLLDVAKTLKESLMIDHAISVAGVDFPSEKKFTVNYNVSTYSNEDLKDNILTLKIDVPREDPRLPSLINIWESVNFFERETYEMFGVIFENHPNLDKLFTKDNWDGPPPLRKDVRFPEVG